MTHLTPLLTLDLETRWYWMKGMKKLLAAMFVALMMTGCGEAVQEEAGSEAKVNREE